MLLLAFLQDVVGTADAALAALSLVSQIVAADVAANHVAALSLAANLAADLHVAAMETEMATTILEAVAKIRLDT